MSVQPLPNSPGTEPVHSPMASPVQDMRRLQRNSAATASELKEFLAQMEGKSPREMLGAIASSSLFKSFISATFLIGILVVAGTIGPFFWNQIFPPAETATAETKAAPAPAQPASAAPAAPAQPAATETAATPAAPAGVDLSKEKEITGALGIGEEKQASPNVNPLESASDDLLKGLD